MVNTQAAVRRAEARTCRRAAAGWLVAVALLAAAGCDVNGALERLTEARRLTADILVQFTRAADAANRAVMADTDETSVAFSHEAETAKDAVQKDTTALAPLLQALGYTEESRLLQEFVTRFSDYRELDRRILDLAVENTNLKAQRLSFGPADDAANSFRDAVDALVASAPEKDRWRAQALGEKAIATVREIQVLQAPHIANADEAVMTRMEMRMATSESAARMALSTLSTIVPPAARTRVTAASAALDQFMALNAQIIALSRRNTNVRSLALSLDQKRSIVSGCEESLHALQDALSTRGFTGTRQR